MASGVLHRPPVGNILLVYTSTSFIVSLLIITNSFVYRYIHLCRAEFSYIYVVKKWRNTVIAVNALVVIDWLIMTVHCGLNNNFDRVQNVSVVESLTGFDLHQTGFLAYSNQMSEDGLAELLVAGNMFLIWGLLVISCFCAIRIAITLKKSTINSNARKLHSQLFMLLLIQTACPALLLQAPLTAVYVLLFSGTSSSGTIGIVIGIMFALFPNFDPLIPMIFLKEYRTYIVGVIRMKADKQGVTSIIVRPTIIT
ncbi:hypothetical protein KIN20_018768 [Parelaphostrongylus tenuis]|uniref:G protein-coupled receptor n=1 Tax=Parelaphostrongylus tenuis TaxID=148309 RepID=A0AAD5N7X0_PARTN|nr:hypothetical protein KIN20_018768 [Parelaphostrongylus tenuis]